VGTAATEVTVGAELGALRDYVDGLEALKATAHLLGWDEKTKMPHKAAAGRARQKGLLAGMYHQRFTSPETLRLIEGVENVDPDNVEARLVRRDYEIATKLPEEHVVEFTQAASLANHAWESAREQDDFTIFEPHLSKVLELSRRSAQYFGYETEPYDALHDQFEEGSRAAELEPLFEQLRSPINALIDRQPEPDTSALERTYPIADQVAYCERIADAIGYDLQAGRIDETVHPFCTNIGPYDVRLTTRYQEDWLPAALFSVIHEAGHGIYEQAFDRLELPAVTGQAPGLGMHESQSRMYENTIGRSRAFWEYHYGELQRTFPGALGSVDLDGFVRQINTAQRSFIRVEADELTYNLHIAVRFELERAMVNGDLEAKDLPGAWNDTFEKWLGMRPPSDREGCLQDVHWTGLFGYFPTYTLGNVYAAQFVEECERAIGPFEDHLRRGEIAPIREWFDEHVYRHGRTLTGKEFVQRITGGPVDAGPLIRSLEQKFG
jgi:carboxypeptidase Taq